MEIKTYVEKDEKKGIVSLIVTRGKTTCQITVDMLKQTVTPIFENNKNT